MAISKILLLISTTCRSNSEKSEKTALEIATRNQAELLIFFVLDDKMSQEIVNHLTEEGWFGGKVSETLHASILKEYLIHGERRMREIEAAAKEQGIACRSISKRGDFVDVSFKVIQEEKPDQIIATRCESSFLSRFIFGSPLTELQKKTDVEIMIVDEK